LKLRRQPDRRIDGRGSGVLRNFNAAGTIGFDGNGDRCPGSGVATLPGGVWMNRILHASLSLFDRDPGPDNRSGALPKHGTPPPANANITAAQQQLLTTTCAARAGSSIIGWICLAPRAGEETKTHADRHMRRGCPRSHGPRIAAWGQR